MTEAPGQPTPPAEPAPASTEMPQGYRNVFTDDQWASLPDSTRAGIVAREQRASLNHREQIQRIKGDIGSLVRQEVQSLQQPPAQANGKSNGTGDSWSEVPDSEFNQLYNEAQARLDAARANPDDEAAQTAAARVTPELMAQFRREEIRRAAHKEARSLVEEREAKHRATALQNSIREKIVSDFGADEGEAILHEGNPLYEAANAEYAKLVEMNGGADAPGFAYAAYRAAALQANRGQPSPVARRDQAIQDGARRQTEIFRDRAALRQKGDVFSAHKADLDAFLSDQPITPDALPAHVRRRMPV